MSLVAELQRRSVFKVGAAYLVVGWLKARERMDVYDRDTDFNPLHL